MTRAELIDRYRFLGLALAGSAALHAAVMVGVPAREESVGEKPGTGYSASLDPAAAVAQTAPAPVAKPAPRPRVRRALPLLPTEPLLDPIAPDNIASAIEEPVLQAPEIAKPEVVALAQPAVPVKALEAPR